MNCKPGDLAYVVRSLTPSEIGLVVRVVEPARRWTEIVGEPCWNIEFTGSRLVRDAYSDKDVLVSGEACIKDSLLRPISGVPVHDEQLDEVMA